MPIAQGTGGGGGGIPEWVKRARAAGYAGAGYAPKPRATLGQRNPALGAAARAAALRLIQSQEQRRAEERAAVMRRTVRARSGELGPTLSQYDPRALGEVFSMGAMYEPPAPTVKGARKRGDLGPVAPYGTWNLQWGKIAQAAGLTHASLGITADDVTKFRLSEYYAGLEAPPSAYQSGGYSYSYPGFSFGGGGGARQALKEWFDGLYRWNI